MGSIRTYEDALGYGFRVYSLPETELEGQTGLFKGGYEGFHVG